MRTVSILVFIIAAGMILATLGLFMWRRRRAAVVVDRPKLWLNERTLFATTYEQVGVARPAPAPQAEQGTACLAYEELGLESAPAPDATALVSMESMLSGPD
jgi:hypothetical protein